MKIATTLFTLGFAIGATGAFGQIRLEAENADLSGSHWKAVRPAVHSGSHLPPGYSGAGYLTGFEDTTDRALFHFKVKKAGLYRLSIAYRCEGKKGIEFEVNDLKVSGMLQPSDRPGFTVEDLGLVELVAGKNVIALDRGWGYYEADYLELAQVTAPAELLRPIAPPSDGAASAEARALLRQIDDHYGKVTLLGVYDDEDAQYVKDATGRSPSVMGGDLRRYSPSFLAHGAEPGGEIERLIGDAQAGDLITLSWHWSAPLGLMNTAEKPWYKGFYADAASFDVSKAMADPESRERLFLLSHIDEIAVQLRRLQDAKVAVPWRPLLEAQDQTFWWWGAKGAKPFVQLWQLLFDRLVNVDGIHNLLWVFTSGGDPAWYPGDHFVDVVGIDAYPTDLHDPQSSLWLQLQAQYAGRKPLAISEFGGGRICRRCSGWASSGLMRCRGARSKGRGRTRKRSSNAFTTSLEGSASGGGCPGCCYPGSAAPRVALKFIRSDEGRGDNYYADLQRPYL